jgi:hypothetical protein
MKEEKGEEWSPPTLSQTIAKLEANKYQYASAGDVKRLIDEINRLQGIVSEMSLAEIARIGQEIDLI